MRERIIVMMIKKSFGLNSGSIILLFYLTICGFVFNAHDSFAAISTDSYCQLTIQLMQQESSNIQTLIPLANQYKDDPTTLAQKEEIKRAQFEQSNTALYAQFGTTANEYMFYMGKHSSEVNEYLKNNPDLKNQIDSLSAQISNLVSQYESLKEPKIKK
jgi:chaperonin cofactor prefoldin